MLKYGRLDAAASLIGIDGQPPPRHRQDARAVARPGGAAGGLAPVGSGSAGSGSADSGSADD
jgi:hypothetical protein